MSVIVESAYGRLEGRADEGCYSFRGIPYAAPPGGPGRFRAPGPVEPWVGVRPADAFGPVAPQLPSPLETLLGSAPLVMDEDGCLTLNVWTPGVDGGRRPVLVWIHGGAFITGSGSTPWYDGAALAARRDVVVVTLNYRLGVLGFLNLGELAGERFADSGNAGLLDQIAALRWVRDNIDRFGGDPANVTVFGESAGAMSVGALLAMPAAKGLFRRAILQSGAGHNALPMEEATRVAAEVLDRLGLGRQAADVAEVPLDRLLAVQGEIGGAYASRGLAFQPVVDGRHLPALPVEAVRSAGADVDILIGTNRDEFNLFSLLDPRFSGMDEARAAALAGGFLGTAGDEVLQLYRAHRPEAPLAAVVSAIASDGVFRVPAIRLAEATATGGGQAWMYLFSWATPALGGRLGSCHALELPFVFDNLHQPGVSVFCGEDPPAAVADVMSDAWTSFARDGRPEAPSLPGWEPYAPEGRGTMILDVETELRSDPWGAERAAWEGLR